MELLYYSKVQEEEESEDLLSFLLSREDIATFSLKVCSSADRAYVHIYTNRITRHSLAGGRKQGECRSGQPSSTVCCLCSTEKGN